MPPSAFTLGLTTPFQCNPLKTRQDLANFLTDLLDPLASHTSPGGARIHLGHTGTHYDEVAAHLEGFSRPIWGLASLLARGGSYSGTQRWLDGFTNGTDPEHVEYWGAMRDKDQRMVECSAIGFSIAVAKEKLWDPLSDDAKAHFEVWLSGMNDKEMPNTNWLWFRVFSNLGLARAGSSRYDAKRMKADMDHLDTFYLGDGWARDGPEGVVQLDYYSSSFAIQYAQLVYSKLANKEDPVRCDEYRNRARRFALDFVHYFDDEGRAIPFGRSMVYRFAMSSFWSALAFADVDLPAPLTWGIVKGIALRNIRYWANQPGAYNHDGTLTIGFNYPNQHLTENYNSPGSPYWCCKSFIGLALPETHPFWTAEEEPYPAFLKDTRKPLFHPLHIMSSVGGHTFLLSSGQQCAYPVKQSAAKYGKFAYSSAFGYSVSTGGGSGTCRGPTATGTVGTGGWEKWLGNNALDELAADSALAVSVDDASTWVVRRDTRDARIIHSADKTTFWLQSIWYPFPGVSIETWLVPPVATTSPLWHLRVHHIRSDKPLLTAEGGFAIYGQGKDGRALAAVEPGSEEYGVVEGGVEARAASRAGVSGIVDLSAKLGTARKGKALRTDANSNLIVPRAVLPTLLHEVEDGEAWYVTGVFGLPNVGKEDGARAGWQNEWAKRPVVPVEILSVRDAAQNT